MGKHKPITPDQEEWLKANSATLTIPQIADKFGLTYNSAVHYVRFNKLPYLSATGKIKARQYDYFSLCPITGFKL